jgi:hypothetical protein
MGDYAANAYFALVALSDNCMPCEIRRHDDAVIGLRMMGWACVKLAKQGLDRDPIARFLVLAEASLRTILRDVISRDARGLTEADHMRENMDALDLSVDTDISGSADSLIPAIQGIVPVIRPHVGSDVWGSLIPEGQVAFETLRKALSAGARTSRWR